MKSSALGSALPPVVRSSLSVHIPSRLPSNSRARSLSHAFTFRVCVIVSPAPSLPASRSSIVSSAARAAAESGSMSETALSVPSGL